MYLNLEYYPGRDYKKRAGLRVLESGSCMRVCRQVFTLLKQSHLCLQTVLRITEISEVLLCDR